MLKTPPRPHKPTGLTPSRTKKPNPVAAEQETPNPAPDKDYSDKRQQPVPGTEENDPDIESD